MTAIEVLRGGLNGLIEYLSLHVITCLVPALFIAGVFASSKSLRQATAAAMWP